MGLIKKLFYNVAAKYCKHKVCDVVYSIQAKKKHVKGTAEKVIRYDVYEVKRCEFCKKDVKERIIKSNITEKQVVEIYG